MNKLERLQAELELTELEVWFAEQKLAGNITAEDKTMLRDARRDFRENFRQPKPGATPEPITTEVN